MFADVVVSITVNLGAELRSMQGIGVLKEPAKRQFKEQEGFYLTQCAEEGALLFNRRCDPL